MALEVLVLISLHFTHPTAHNESCPVHISSPTPITTPALPNWLERRRILAYYSHSKSNVIISIPNSRNRSTDPRYHIYLHLPGASPHICPGSGCSSAKPRADPASIAVVGYYASPAEPGSGMGVGRGASGGFEDTSGATALARMSAVT